MSRCILVFLFVAPNHVGIPISGVCPKQKLGGRKSYLAAKHHDEAAPKTPQKTRFFRLGAEKYDFRVSKGLLIARTKVFIFYTEGRHYIRSGHT